MIGKRVKAAHWFAKEYDFKDNIGTIVKELSKDLYHISWDRPFLTERFTKQLTPSGTIIFHSDNFELLPYDDTWV